MQIYRTLLVVQDPNQIVIPQTPFHPGQLVEVLVLGEKEDRNALAQDLVSLFKETQSLPQLQQLSEEEIEAEIAMHRGAR